MEMILTKFKVVSILALIRRQNMIEWKSTRADYHVTCCTIKGGIGEEISVFIWNQSYLRRHVEC